MSLHKFTVDIPPTPEEIRQAIINRELAPRKQTVTTSIKTSQSVTELSEVEIIRKLDELRANKRRIFDMISKG